MSHRGLSLEQTIHISSMRGDFPRPRAKTKRGSSGHKALLSIANLGKKDSIETREKKKESFYKRRWCKEAWQEYFSLHNLSCSDDFDANRRTFYLFKLGPNFEPGDLTLDQLRIAYRKNKSKTDKKIYQRYKESLAKRPKPNICECCNEARSKIVFDHCHQQGHFRGWICDRCNRALGLIEDNLKIANCLINYLQKDALLSSQEKADLLVDLKLAGFEGKIPKTFKR